MEPWLNPLYDAEGMRAVDRWAIEEQGVPSLELMEAAGRAVAEAVAELAAEGRCGSSAARGTTPVTGWWPRGICAEMGFEVEALLLWPAEELAGTLRRTSSASRPSMCQRGLGARLAGSGGRRRRDLRDRVLPGSRGSRRRRRSRRSIAAGRRWSPATSPPGSTPRPARSRGWRSRPISPSASTRRSSGTGSLPASGTRASCGWFRSGSRTGRRASRRRGRSTPRCWRWRRGADRARPSSARARSRSPAARAASPGRCGCPRRRRSGPAPATPPSPCRPTSSRSSRRASPR